MNKKHLLWWIFCWLGANHPDVLSQMLDQCDGNFGDNATSTVNIELNAAFERFSAAKLAISTET